MASAEASKAAADRSMEKAANAAVAMGKKPSSFHDKKPASSGGTTKAVEPGGGKSSWVGLIKILAAGGREARGGLGAVQFGTGFDGSRILSDAARKQKNQEWEPYAKLPADFRAVVSKKEYEATHYRGDDDELENKSTETGLFPVIVFSFSKKKCEEISDFLSGQDLLTATEKGKVRNVMVQVIKRLNPLDAGLPQVQNYNHSSIVVCFNRNST